MPLTQAQRERAWPWWTRRRSANPDASPMKFTKTDLRTALDASVAWIEANQASFVGALPAPFSTQSTADEKRRMFLTAFAAVYDLDLEL